MIDQIAHFLRGLPASEARELLPRNVVVLAHMFPVLGQLVRRETAAVVASESAELKMRGSRRFARCSGALRSATAC